MTVAAAPSPPTPSPGKAEGLPRGGDSAGVQGTSGCSDPASSRLLG